MFKFQEIWFPDGEKHFPDWMTKNGEIVDGKGTYQIKKWRACIPWIKRFDTAIDIGGHVGLWSMQMLKRFKRVRAFEPVEDFRRCFRLNCNVFDQDTIDNDVHLYDCALGAAPGRVAMKIPLLDGGLDTGGTHVGGDGDIEMRTLDSFSFSEVDFIKIDCEGYEHHVIEGARETLLRCRPCVIVEQKPHKLGPNFGIKGTPAVDLLQAMGAHVRKVLSGDYILTFDQ